ncbi:MAG: replicative DNA helicase [Dysgonamonadaceae bacterium]|jgi:replicative DNA helicase|nr:replicative DNA helicase [Dysgonamonadaceae bacterium]
MIQQDKNRQKTGTRTKKTVVNTEEIGRLQPQARELEEAVLGALMIEKDAYSIISEILSPECFYDKAHELIFTAIQNLAIQQKPIDILTVVDQLRKAGDLEMVGGASYIAVLSQKMVSSAHLDYHARIVAQKYLARELIRFSSEVAGKAFDETNDVDDLMQEAEGQLFEITQRNVKKDVSHINPIIKEAFALMREAAKRTDGLSGLQTGFKDLDKITSGWQNSDLIIIAARPAMGKTAFMLSMAKNMAVNFNIPVAVFSLEMSNVQLVNRLIVNVTELVGEKIKTGQLAPHEWHQLDSKVRILYDAPIYVDETPSLSVFELRTKARRLVKEHKVKCIIIDYLQLMNASGMSFGSREQEVSIISRSLKGLAKELNIPIIALSQLNRSVENRTGRDGYDAKRPQLSDLRESGAIEQDADIVCFIHRPEYYKIFQDDHGNDLTGKAEIIIAKHRNGSTGDVLLEFKKEYARFQNLNENQIIEEYQSRVNSQADLIPAEKSGRKSMALQSELSENMPF